MCTSTLPILLCFGEGSPKKKTKMHSNNNKSDRFFHVLFYKHSESKKAQKPKGRARTSTDKHQQSMAKRAINIEEKLI